METTVDPFKRLIEITRSMTRVQAPAPLLKQIIEAAVEISGAERGYLFLLDPDETLPLPERLQVGAAHQLEPDHAKSAGFGASRTVILKTLVARCGLEWVDALSEPNPSQSVEMRGLRSIICEPLTIHNKILGLLYLDSQLTARFNDGHREILPSLAAQAAICIENTRLLVEREESLRREHEEQAYRNAMAAFMAIASHDLKGPLTVLKTGLSVLRASGADSELMDDMGLALRKAQRLVAMYLDANQLGQNEKLNLVKSQLDLHAMVAEELHHLERYLSPSRRQQFEFANQVPADTMVSADSDRLRQVLANLLENAVKYSPSGGSVTVSAEAGSDGVWLEVKDQGRGISEDGLAHLFEPYVRVHPDDIRGSGLGLWIVRRLIESHGGRIEVTSREGEGSVFRVFLPR